MIEEKSQPKKTNQSKEVKEDIKAKPNQTLQQEQHQAQGKKNVILKLKAQPFKRKEKQTSNPLLQLSKRQEDKKGTKEIGNEIVLETSEEETEDNDEIIKESDIEEDKVEEKVLKIMKKLNIEESTQEKLIRLGRYEDISDRPGNYIIIEHVEKIDEEDMEYTIEDNEIKEKEELSKIDKIRNKILKKLQLEIDEETDTIFATVSVMYYLKKINKEKSNLYINMKRLLEVDLDNVIREQVNMLYDLGIIRKEDKERILKDVKTNEKYKKAYELLEESDEDSVNDSDSDSDDDYEDSNY